MNTRISILLCVVTSICLGQVGLADWTPNDGHKMHYPQMPDPKGWDVCLRQMGIADDFECSETGPINDIHFWVSWKDDFVREVPLWNISIHEDREGWPGKALWHFKEGKIVVKYEEPSMQGWLCPCAPTDAEKVAPENHTRYALVNVMDIQEPFKQEKGVVYWLVIRANMALMEQGIYQPEVGWKTSVDHFRRPAVWVKWPMSTTDSVWDVVAVPEYKQTDMAFVINGRGVQPLEMDFGDAPQLYCFTTPCPFYPTTLANDGARHIINGDVYLGNPLIDYPQIDGEKDGQPTVGADGDDMAGFDDEAGVHLPKSITPGTTVGIIVWASTDGLLDAWIDFNVDGDWADRGEQVFVSQKLAMGQNELKFEVPLTCNVDTKQTYGRFRFSTAGGLNYFGPAKDGEVEDYQIWINPCPQPRLDFGDAPDGDFVPGGYPTILLNNGARHKINPDVRLGRYIDGEQDGQPSVGADGDDLDNLDDEDGVLFGGPLVRGETAEIKVIASADGFLSAWIDFNADKDWQDVGEQIFAAHKIAAGVNYLKFQVPNNSAGSGAGSETRTYARFRYTTVEESARIGYVGLAEDGEVEDYVVVVEEPQLLFDFGDAPEWRCGDPDVVRCNSYPTTLAREGARHVIVPGVHLGNPYTDVIHIDAEPDGQPTAAADGDDITGADDEDGVTFVSPLIPGHPAKVDVEVSTDGYLDAWIDFNHDGDWDDYAEQIFAGQKVMPGTNGLEFKVPLYPHAVAANTPTYARFRFNTHGSLKYAGAAQDGEVEDYLVKIEQPDRIADLGDAPDSSNSFGVSMTAYTSMGMLPVIVPGRFPTVYRKGSPPYGPIHWLPEFVHLGAAVSQEIEADYGYDQDSVNNLVPLKDKADLDRADDGVRVPLFLPPCRATNFAYTVNIRRPVDRLFVNVWLDFNRDGDFDDVLPCVLPDDISDNQRAAREWAVRNQAIIGSKAGLHEFRTPSFVSWHPRMLGGTASPIWMRITISEKPWQLEYADEAGTIAVEGSGGSGPEEGYWTGETEDYFFVPLLDVSELADLNGDLKVDIRDFAIMASQWLFEIDVQPATR
jgi:hypothetical protein